MRYTDWSLDIINVTDKSNPYQVGRCSAGDRVYRITLVNNYAYLATWSGLRIVDISNYSSPKLVGSYNYKDSQANGIFVRDNYAYLADHYEGLLIFDVSIPSLPRLEGKLNTPGNGYEVVVNNNTAYMASAGAGVHVIDVKDKSNPYLVRTIDTPGGAQSLILEKDYLYIADGTSLIIIKQMERRWS